MFPGARLCAEGIREWTTDTLSDSSAKAETATAVAAAVSSSIITIQPRPSFKKSLFEKVALQVLRSHMTLNGNQTRILNDD